MDTKISQLLLACTLILLFLIPPSLSHANGKNASSPFNFIKHLQGCHKGEKVKGLHNLKLYLNEFGYLNYSPNKTTHNSVDDDDDFDDFLQSAIKTYQHNHHLKPTGTLDAETTSEMMMPRCGMPDIINGKNWMVSNKKHKHRKFKSIHALQHYSFMNGNPKWPASKTHLTYGFSPNTPTSAINAVSRAFVKWQSATHFTFSPAANFAGADLKIGFYGRDHNDGHPFDGPGGTIAHAFGPTNGRFHYDADESWAIGPLSGAFDVETVALHEIGHLLGLGHSSVQNSIMWPTIATGVTKALHEDDIQGIKALYNVN